MTLEERARLMTLGRDLDRAWHHPGATPETRKRILRTVLAEIVARVEGDEITLVLHWQGGDHTRSTVQKNRPGRHRWTTEASTEQLIRELSRLMPDPAIAWVLNRAGKRTGRGNTWTEARVRSFRGDHRIAVYRDGERSERGELTLDECICSRIRPVFPPIRPPALQLWQAFRKSDGRPRPLGRGLPWASDVSSLYGCFRGLGSRLIDGAT
jgi:hypothetical protein